MVTFEEFKTIRRNLIFLVYVVTRHALRLLNQEKNKLFFTP
jgi:hypothetical protein